MNKVHIYRERSTTFLQYVIGVQETMLGS